MVRFQGFHLRMAIYAFIFIFTSTGHLHLLHFPVQGKILLLKTGTYSGLSDRTSDCSVDDVPVPLSVFFLSADSKDNLNV